MHILENKKGLPSTIQVPSLKNQNKESKLNQGKQKEESITDKEKNNEIKQEKTENICKIYIHKDI